MIESRGGARFTLESVERLAIQHEMLGQEFQRDEPAESEVFGFIHHPHATATHLLEDAVMGDGLAGYSPCQLIYRVRGS